MNDPQVAAVNPLPALFVGKENAGLDHLASFSFSFDTPTRKGVHCFVQFTTHCYSDKFDPGRHSENVVVLDERDMKRCFNQDRYDLSKGLKELIRDLPKIRVHQTQESNFAIITMQNNREYRVYFNVHRLRKKALRIYVESAYAPDPERFKVPAAAVYQKVRFLILVDKVLNKERLTFKSR